jgi:hypothetical protein
MEESQITRGRGRPRVTIKKGLEINELEKTYKFFYRTLGGIKFGCCCKYCFVNITFC